MNGNSKRTQVAMLENASSDFPPYLLILTRGGTHRLQYSSHVGNHHSSSSHRDGHSTQTKVHSIPGCPTVKDTIPCLGCTVGLKFKKDSRYIL